MKRYARLGCIVLTCVLSGCEEVATLECSNSVAPQEVVASENLVKAYLTDVEGAQGSWAFFETHDLEDSSKCGNTISLSYTPMSGIVGIEKTFRINLINGSVSEIVEISQQ